MISWPGNEPIDLPDYWILRIHFTSLYRRIFQRYETKNRSFACPSTRPQILLLDEPTGGLDVTSARTVRQLVRKLKEEGGTVIYSTHHLAEAQQV